MCVKNSCTIAWVITRWCHLQLARVRRCRQLPPSDCGTGITMCRLLSEGEVQLLDALALGGLAAAVVAGGGDDGGVAGELLRGREVHAGVEQIRHKRAAQVVRRDVRHASLRGALLEHVVDGDGAEAGGVDLPDLRDREEQLARVVAAAGEPGVYGRPGGGRQGHQALLVALAVADA